MATDLKIILDDVPGQLAALGEATGLEGINLDGVVGVTAGGKGEIHVLVEDANAARETLSKVGIDVAEAREVVVIDCADEPGELGRITSKIAAAGVNINLAYLATNTRLVIGADDLDKAKEALG